MIKIKLYQKKWGLNELKRDIKNYGEVNIIGALCKDNLGWFYNYNPNTIAHLKNIIEAINKSNQELGEDEKEWLENIHKLKDKLSSFDKYSFKQLSVIEQDKYLRKFTSNCSMILEELVKGELREGELSPLEYYALCSKMVFVKNKFGIKTPIDLPIEGGE